MNVGWESGEVLGVKNEVLSVKSVLCSDFSCAIIKES